MTEYDGDAETGLSVQLTRRRLIEARWVLAVTVAILGFATQVFSMPISFAAIGFTVIVAATMLNPRRRAEDRSNDQAARIGDAWPDASIRVTVEALPDAGIIVDRRGIVRTVNGETERLFGPVLPGDPISFRLRVPALLQALEHVASGAPAERIAWYEKVSTERFYLGRIRSSGAVTDNASPLVRRPLVNPVRSQKGRQFI